MNTTATDLRDILSRFNLPTTAPVRNPMVLNISVAEIWSMSTPILSLRSGNVGPITPAYSPCVMQHPTM